MNKLYNTQKNIARDLGKYFEKITIFINILILFCIVLYMEKGICGFKPQVPLTVVTAPSAFQEILLPIVPASFPPHPYRPPHW